MIFFLQFKTSNFQNLSSRPQLHEFKPDNFAILKAHVNAATCRNKEMHMQLLFEAALEKDYEEAG